MELPNNDLEVTPIRKDTPIPLTVHFPKTKEGRDELAGRVAEIHADAIFCRIKQLRCPAGQKQELLDAILEIIKQRSRGQEY